MFWFREKEIKLNGVVSRKVGCETLQGSSVNLPQGQVEIPSLHPK